MGLRGKQPAFDPSIQWKVSIPKSIVAPITLLLADPLTGKAAKGARSKLISNLLREWLAEQIRNQPTNEE